MESEPVAAAQLASVDGRGALATALEALIPGASRTGHVVTVVSGPAGVKDLAGNALVANRVWGFGTGTLACTSRT